MTFKHNLKKYCWILSNTVFSILKSCYSLLLLSMLLFNFTFCFKECNGRCIQILVNFRHYFKESESCLQNFKNWGKWNKPKSDITAYKNGLRFLSLVIYHLKLSKRLAVVAYNALKRQLGLQNKLGTSKDVIGNHYISFKRESEILKRFPLIKKRKYFWYVEFSYKMSTFICSNRIWSIMIAKNQENFFQNYFNFPPFILNEKIHFSCWK